MISILDVPLLNSPPIPLVELTADLPTLESPKADKELARIELSESPLYRNLLLCPDAQTTALLINFPDDEIYFDWLQQRNKLREKKAAGSLSPAEQAELKCLIEQFRQHRDKMRRRRHEDIIAIIGRAI